MVLEWIWKNSKAKDDDGRDSTAVQGFENIRRYSSASHTKRRIFVNIPVEDKFREGEVSTGKTIFTYKANKVRSSKYTLVNFLPKNIFEQFRGVANFYFLSLVILQSFDLFKVVDVIVTAMPIIIIVTVTAIKDAFEDYKRSESDKSVNKARTYFLSNYQNTNFNAPSAESLLTKTKNYMKEGQKAFVALVISVVNWIWNLVLTLTHKPTQAAIATDTVAWPDKIYGIDYINETVSDPHHDASQADPFRGVELWKVGYWQNAKVGDFVYLRSNDSIPADILVLSTSEPDSLCYVETKNLDGETNLKIKKGLSAYSHIKTPEDCHNVFCHIDSEPPNANLYTFYGTLTVRSPPGVPESAPEFRNSVPLSMTGMLLRGSTLRNTKWLIGIVVYTGPDTKIVLNSGKTPSKRSRIERQLNPQVVLNFVILACMCLICALAAAVYQVSFVYEKASFSASTFGADPLDTPLATAFLTFFNCMIIFQNIIPIALFLSLDITKTVQSYLIHSDEEMRDPDTQKLVSPQSWNLCDDLGQIEYIFSDKTGTLTSNTMEFRRATIDGIMYGTFDVHPNKAKLEATEKLMRAQMSELYDTKYVSPTIPFVDTKIPEHLKENGLQARRIREFFTLLAVCHTVLVEKKDRSKPDHLVYNAQSPDEAALVCAAKDNGFAFLKRENNVIVVDVMGVERRYTVLNVLEFTSDRKRMSVIVRRPEGEIILLTKGADSIIFERLSRENDQNLQTVTSDHLSLFANQGLRTLCLAYRVVSDKEFAEWSEKYKAAQNMVDNRQETCDLIADTIEQDLILMGATAIEDKLQEGVPESIAILAKAGIKIWVLTGDKMETAINIGFSCNLLKRDMTLIVVKAQSIDDSIGQLKEALSRFWTLDGRPIENNVYALIIEGETLKHALDPLCKQLLLEMACRCKAVICCRVSPLQKALVVQLVRNGLNAMCLAVGDGANDVSMIQAADIGIGIMGKEGLQAVMASDYAIGQFRFLSRLLLVHGRWAYVRSSALVLNYFYKNAVWLFILFWHQFFCAFSAGIITDFTYGEFFQTVFTLLPTVFIGVFDQDIGDELSMKVPQIYLKGIFQSLYSMNQFWVYMVDALYQSIMCYFIGYLIYFDATPSPLGLDGGLESTGSIISFAAILVVNIYCLVNWNSWTYLTHIGFWLSIIIWTAYFIGYSSIPTSPTYGYIYTGLTSPVFYGGIIVTISIAISPRMIIKWTQQYFWPSDTDIIQEYQKFYFKSGERVAFDVETASKMEQIPETTISQADSATRQKEALKEKVHSSVTDVHATKSQTTDQLKRARSEDAPLGFGGSLPTSAGDSGAIIPVIVDPVSYLVPSEPSLGVSSDGFGGISSPKIPSKSIDLTQESRSRRTSLSSVFRTGVTKASQFVKRLAEKSTPTTTTQASKLRAPSLVYLGDQRRQVANSGFAFSQDTGMSDIITPTTRVTFEDEDRPTQQRKKKGPASRLRNLSSRLSNVIHVNLITSNPFPSLPRLYSASPTTHPNHPTVAEEAEPAEPKTPRTPKK